MLLVLLLVFILVNLCINFFKPIPTTYIGNVIHGMKQVRLIDWPTANIENDGSFPMGTFSANTKYGNAFIFSNSNIIEMHICSFKGDVYGEEIEITDIKREMGNNIFTYFTFLSCLLG